MFACVLPLEVGFTLVIVSSHVFRVEGDGERLVAEKKSLVPIGEVMLAEKKGGWGRSIRGIEYTISKLNRTEGTSHLAMQLQAHLDLVTCARMLQPTQITSLIPSKLKEVLDKLTRAGIKLEPPTQLLLLKKVVADVVQGCAEPESRATKLYDLLRPWGSEVPRAEVYTQ